MEKQNTEEQLKEVIEKATHKELIKFIEVQCGVNEQFKNLFLSSFAHLNDNQSKEFYNQQIRLVLESVMDRHDFIGWYQMKYLLRGIDPIVAISENQFKNENYKVAINICSALLEEMTEAIQFSDDSGGDIGGIIENAYQMLLDISTKNISADLKKELFDYCIFTFNKGLFKGWSWHIGMLTIAYNLIDSITDIDIILNCLDTMQDKYERKNAQNFKLEILEKHKGKEEVQNFIELHIDNPTIRKDEIEKAVENQDFNRAKQLLLDGIKFDQEDRPGLVNEWYDLLLKIAQFQNDKSKLIEYARYLFINSFKPKVDYYEILKQNVAKKEWKELLEDLISEISPKKSWNYSEKVRSIFIKEQWWDRLFLMLKENLSLENIANNEEYLSKDYNEELIKLYKERISSYLERFEGRNNYKTACSYLKRMKKLSDLEGFIAFVNSIKTTYPKRKALLDELNKLV
ncbi:hypothetical protein ERX46_13215 [Brumimicrobium glaciale]|uniref:Uncharacterized protein n=1 Tax=Brumimicrobium glaciale TaxID=200475 RepID=A0A4Q4KIL0_9FLAO|nr:hypothetical protein [Brumimicrobium glaciale]RYM33005.1 hypothetical protein ERX46_13215 [Brumimicrobium glaciale]